MRGVTLASSEIRLATRACTLTISDLKLNFNYLKVVARSYYRPSKWADVNEYLFYLNMLRTEQQESFYFVLVQFISFSWLKPFTLPYLNQGSFNKVIFIRKYKLLSFLTNLRMQIDWRKCCHDIWCKARSNIFKCPEQLYYQNHETCPHQKSCKITVTLHNETKILLLTLWSKKHLMWISTPKWIVVRILRDKIL